MCVYFCLFFFFSDRIDPVVLKCCKRAHSNGNISSSALFKWPKNWRTPGAPPTLIIFPESPDQNSEIAILFSIVEKPYNSLWGRLTPPQSLWEGLHVTNFDLCLHIVMVIGKCQDVFRGIFWLGVEGGSFWVEGDMLGELSME